MTKYGIALAAFVLASKSALAVSVTSPFGAETALDLAILASSSRIAPDHTDNLVLLAYAANEMGAQVAFVRRCDAAPNVASLETLKTGRSAAVAEPPSHTVTVRVDVPTATAGLATLNSLHGAVFDRLFVIMQRDALIRIEERYRRLERHKPAMCQQQQSRDIENRIGALNSLE